MDFGPPPPHLPSTKIIRKLETDITLMSYLSCRDEFNFLLNLDAKTNLNAQEIRPAILH
jgi:hypothetical protein